MTENPTIKLSEHAILDKIAKHVNIQVYDRDGGTSSPRIRLELRTKGMDASLLEEVMAVQTPCVRCGKPVSPFRKRATRTGGAGRVDGLQGHIYIAIACPLKDNYGCCRGAEADHEYVAIRERVCAILGVDPGSYSTKRTTTGRTRSRKTTNEEKQTVVSVPLGQFKEQVCLPAEPEIPLVGSKGRAEYSELHCAGSDPETTEISKRLDELQDEWNKVCPCLCGACSIFDGRLIVIVDTILRLPAEANNTAVLLSSFAAEWVQACDCECTACIKLSEGIENVITRLQAYADKSVDGRDVASVPDPDGDFAKMKQDVDSYIAGESTWCGGLVRCPTCGTMHNESGPEARKIRDVVKPATETAARYVGAALNQIAAKARGLPIQVQEYHNRDPKFVALVGYCGVGGQGTTAQEALLDMAEKMGIRVQYPNDDSPRSDAVQPSEEKPWVPCRFCGKGPDKVKKLIQAKDGTTICDTCVDLAWDIVHDKVSPKSYDVAPAPEKPPSQPNTTRRISFHVDFDGDPKASIGSLTLQAEGLDLHDLLELAVGIQNKNGM